jgi:hypothetical protein
MKNYVSAIIICSVILLFFPFLGLSEFWEYLFVVIPAFIIAYSGMWLSRNLAALTADADTDSLHDYIEKLQKRFKDQKAKQTRTAVLHHDHAEE